MTEEEAWASAVGRISRQTGAEIPQSDGTVCMMYTGRMLYTSVATKSRGRIDIHVRKVVAHELGFDIFDPKNMITAKCGKTRCVSPDHITAMPALVETNSGNNDLMRRIAERREAPAAPEPTVGGTVTPVAPIVAAGPPVVEVYGTGRKAVTLVTEDAPEEDIDLEF